MLDSLRKNIVCHLLLHAIHPCNHPHFFIFSLITMYDYQSASNKTVSWDPHNASMQSLERSILVSDNSYCPRLSLEFRSMHQAPDLRSRPKLCGPWTFQALDLDSSGFVHSIIFPFNLLFIRFRFSFTSGVYTCHAFHDPRCKSCSFLFLSISFLLSL